MTPFDAEKALLASEIRYRRLFETARDGILLLNLDTGRIEDINPFLLEILGYTRDEMIGKTLWEIGAFKDIGLSKASFVELQQTHYARYEDLPLQTKAGDPIAVEFISNVYDADGIQVIQCSIRDISSRHLAQAELRATARALKMLSAGNNSLLSATDETTLLNEFCRIVVETGSYRMSWVGIGQNDAAKSVVAVAHYGHDDGYLALAQLTWADVLRGNGPVGRALRSQQVQFSEDIALDPSMGPWQAAALARDFHSTIAIPFREPDGRPACLTMYGGKRNAWSAAERALLQEMADDLSFGIAALRMAQDKLQFQEQLRHSLEQTISVIAETVDQHDAYTAGHQRRVADICAHIATNLGLAEETARGLHLAATIHDLGKIGIPAELLTKPRQLSPMEFGLVKEHVQIGYNIIKKVDFPWPIAQIVLQHHERMDGSGYPRGLVGEDILIEARILAVADVVEAMASARPYRRALGIDAALAEIETHRGTTFDAAVVDACLRLFREQGYKIAE